MAESDLAAPAAPSATSLDKSGRTIRDMFAGVAPRYDLLNHLLSGALDHVWRWRSARALGLGAGARVLDLCCGTGDQALALNRRGPRVAAADFCVPMLVRARRKFETRRRRGGAGSAAMAADALALPFPAASFDGATVSFGLRNVADLDRALTGMAAVLRPGGRLAVLEFAVPENRLVRALYLAYFRHVLPVVGRLLSPRGSAYTYLPASVLEFPQRQGFVAALEAAGFEAAAWRDLTFGIVCLYTARRVS
ncbi:MAG TPA: ubiquinone/menaquinone biosynthesis methyltransferase [Thermoanaerobaculia bacterium]|nr:ubiquinone/menaquinone biosynthesis methyltransferase [Thermoanaerobaculia bacterium]